MPLSSPLYSSLTGFADPVADDPTLVFDVELLSTGGFAAACTDDLELLGSNSFEEKKGGQD